jgi:DNA-binding NarL/FixJ family response regulator
MIDTYIVQREAAEAKSPLERLSIREREVLQLVVEGKSSKEIAGILHLSPKSIETYRSRLMQKLNVHDIPSLVKFAIQHGLTTLE